MDFHFFDIPLREPGNDRGEPRLMLYLVGRRGKRGSNIPLNEFCRQINEILEDSGLVGVEVTPSDIIFALRSREWRSMERKHKPGE